MSTSSNNLNEVFSIHAMAQQAPSLVPPRQPGITPDSAKAILELLEDNHRKRHIFFNDKKFHKYVVYVCQSAGLRLIRIHHDSHAAHHILAI